MAITQDWVTALAAHINQHTRQPWATPGELARVITPTTVQTPALDIIDRELITAYRNPDQRLIITMPPQEGKSTRVARDFPVFALCDNPDTRIVVASYGQILANRNGRAIRNTITSHPELGIRVTKDNGSVQDWSLHGRTGGVYSVGVGGGLTGRPADLVIIDDPIKDQAEADSEVIRENIWDWWEKTVASRLGPGASVVVILTRWHEDDLAGRLLKQPDTEWRLLNIPAQADHDPNKGETDVLGREPGEFMLSARGRTVEQWERRKREAGARGWQALYQGAPSPQSGTMFDRSRWRYYERPLWLDRADGSRVVTGFDDLLASWDMAFKETASSDWVVGQVWGRVGADCFLLDQVRGRWDFPETCRRFTAFSARWPQALLKLVEDKANGPAVVATLRNRIPGIVPEEPRGGKVARAQAVTPAQEARQLWLPSPDIAPWVGEFVEEAARFPYGTHDDQVDAMTQAVNRLVVQPLIGGSVFDVADVDAELAGFSIAPI